MSSIRRLVSSAFPPPTAKPPPPFFEAHMPVERTRGSRRTTADGNNLVWTEPSTTPGITFATNVTPTTFVADQPAYSQTFFMVEPTPSPTAPRRSHKRRSAYTPSTPNANLSTDPHIPRPPNAFILFRSSFVRARTVPATLEPSHSALSAIAGMTWAQLPKEQKAMWHAIAREKRQEHAERFPNYTFRPNRRSVSAPVKQRKPKIQVEDDGSGEDDGFVAKPVRDLAPADRDRAAHIADLLVAGFHGESLGKGVELYDATRGKQGPEIRFSVVETPEDRRKQVKERKTAKAATRQRVSSTPGPFDFEVASPGPSTWSTCSSPIDCPSPNYSSSFEWPAPAPSSDVFDFSAYDIDSLPGTAPASPALSFASTSSASSGPLSTSTSYEDLSAQFAADELLDLNLLGLDMSLLDFNACSPEFAPPATISLPQLDLSYPAVAFVDEHRQ
ncbi:HMG box domain-containing protein [Mycena indigotica]|uniref:HMG box domain-containing protein n=1 Tax=Mycena indigotica TaxID=2126181 RepID=A0A8H6SR44_9AGAR|nr:HMG box domain-containing protein [Mycena indigotica]KAF7303510.1 HMG box domain-containing protein [Mycena indigotica]